MLDDVVERLKSGDKTAFRPLVEATQAEVRTWIACKGINVADVDDIAQLTYLHVYQHIDQFESGTNFQAWVYTIASYQTKAFLQKRERELRNQGRYLERYLLNQCAPTTHHEPSEIVQRLHRCLKRLGHRAQQVIRQRYSGVPLSDIAQELGHTVPAVKMMLMRIRLQLRRCMETPS